MSPVPLARRLVKSVREQRAHSYRMVLLIVKRVVRIFFSRVLLRTTAHTAFGLVNGSNLGRNARSDQILHLPTLKRRFSNVGGTLAFFGSDARTKGLFPDEGYTRQQFSFQLSDHFPIWVQIKTDIDEQRLDQIVQNSK